MLAAALSLLKDQFSLDFSAPGVNPPMKVKFDRYVHWLETKLLDASKVELADFDDTLDQLMERICVLKSVSAQCRSSMIVHNSAQINRISKMYDQIEVLEDPYLSGRLFQSAGQHPVTSLLPDLDVVNELVVQTKSKLKAIDEVASSKKNDVVKFKGSKTASSNRSENKKALDISNIRTEVRCVMLLLDQLAAEATKKATVLSYFGQVKQWVHFPLQALSLQLRSLPPLQEASRQMEHELGYLNRAAEHYDAARRVGILAAAAQATREAASIENMAEEPVSAVRLLGNEEVYQVLCQVCGGGSYEGAQDEDGDGGVPEWLYSLRRVAEQPTASVLRFCSTSARKGAFLGDIGQLTAALKRATGEGNPLLNTLSEETVRALQNIDGELVCAFATDWRERVNAYEEVQKRPDFLRAYDQLQALRVAYDRAQHKYERCMYQFNEVVSLHREANQQLGVLKERFVEIALSEVSEEIELVS